MLTRRSRTLADGYTLVELLAAMTIGSAVLALIAAVGLREQRLFAELAARGALAAQLHDAAAVLPIDLRGIVPAADLRDARDTALELRATIASTVVCDTAGAWLILAPEGSTSASYSGFAATLEAGDSLWVYTSSDSAPWRQYAISDVASRGGGSCGSAGPVLDSLARAKSRVSLAVANATPRIAVGTAIRVTRLVRYSVYRASDGAWYLGEKDWNNAASRFNTIQPVAGPLLSPGVAGPVFRYLDSTGATLPAPVAARGAVALIEIAVRGHAAGLVRVSGAAATASRTDSAVVAVALRNRR